MPFDRSPRLAAAYSALCPGCGYFYLHQPGRAATYLGSAPSTFVLVGLPRRGRQPDHVPAALQLQDHDDPLDQLTVLAVAEPLVLRHLRGLSRRARRARRPRLPLSGRQGADDRSPGGAVQSARAQEPVGLGRRAGAARRGRAASPGWCRRARSAPARARSPTEKGSTSSAITTAPPAGSRSVRRTTSASICRSASARSRCSAA